MALDFVSRTTLLGSVAALALLGDADPVSAQSVSEPSTQLEEIVVTGLRSVNGSSQAVRQENIAVVDAITADEVERTPDASLAEVLDRVVGVSSDRGFNSSQGRTVTIRGFDARYNSMDVDGNPVWNSSRNNRGTQLDVFPASVVNQVLVYKTVTPDLDANSIGGHVTLRTLRAFDGGIQPYFKARASAGIYEQDSATGEGEAAYRFDGVGKFTFGPGNRFGLVGGFDVQRESFFDEYNNVTGYTIENGADIPSGSLFPGLFDKTIERQAFYGKLETRSADRLYAFVSAAWFHHTDVEDWYRGGLFLTPTQIDAGGTLSGTFVNATSEAYLEQYDLERTTLSLGSGVDYRLGDDSVVQVRAGYTAYDHDELLSRGERFQLGGLAGTYDISRDFPSVTLTTAPNVTDAAAWRHRTGRDAFDLSIPHEDDVYSLSADYLLNQHPEARGPGLRTGLSWRRLERKFDQTTTNYRLPGGTIFRLSDVAAGGAGNPTGVGPFLIDPALYWGRIRGLGAFSTDQAQTSDYNLVEDVFAAHGSLVYTTERFRGLAGLRIEATEYENETADVVTGTVTPRTRTFDYTEILPNLQGRYDLNENLALRFGYTKTLARPDFGDFAFGQRVTLDVNGFPLVQGANPNLQPRVSSNYDVGLEWAFDAGFLNFGLFHKDLQDETFTQIRQTRDASGVVILTETQPLNTGSAKVTGLEIDGAWRPFQDRGGALEGLELSGNYARFDGEWNVVFTDGSRRTVDGLRNQPEWLANANATYVLGPLETTLSWRLRGRTFTGTFGVTEAGDRWVDEYNRLDLQTNYKLANGFQIFAEARNLTDQFWVEQTGVSGGALSVAVNPGRSLWFGIRVKR